MQFPISGPAALWLAVLFGFVFGALLQRGGVVDYNKIVSQFRFRDFTVLKIMLTAIVVGGIGVFTLHGFEAAQYHIKPANLLAVGLGGLVFGVGMVLYGYCPGTGIAACATGSVHGLIGFLGMLAGGVIYALTFGWTEQHLQKVAALGKVRLPDLTGVPDWIWFVALAVLALAVFSWIERIERARALAASVPRR
ncbi:MAG: YeeE/YedE family protein [Verrucomicrobia bacterium]|nr:YeeE/YedE family protein [Verrucomicrobiota bacterium]